MDCADAAVAIEKLLRDVVPEDVAIQKETIDWVGECAAGNMYGSCCWCHIADDAHVLCLPCVVCVEFLQLVGFHANSLAEKSAKKENYRITSDHVLAALEVLPIDLPYIVHAG